MYVNCCIQANSLIEKFLPKGRVLAGSPKLLNAGLEVDPGKPEQLSRKPKKLLDRNPYWVQLLHREVVPVPKPRRSTDHVSDHPQTLFFPTPARPRQTAIFTTQNPVPSAGPADPIEPLVSVGRAAPLLGISVKTLRDWILYRRIDYVKIGTRVMIRPETIRELVDRNTRRADIA
jgi:excisionase family DNA binding protein